ncbi:eukaryotic rRNA processing protein EBP2-domain-containing protein [Mycena floridula]|nr:eukaryotic rRNA processing protein EBP2-domain-containing protein [Mycena floridula]
MERLMEALGDDGLDEFDQAQLNAALGEGSDSEEGSQEEDGDDDEDDDDEAQGNDAGFEDEDDEDEEAGIDEDMPLDEAESVDEDAIPRQKLEIDNEVAMDRIKETIKLDPSMPWTETLSMTYPETIEVDVNDDLNRELAFYKQALHSANTARTLAAKHNFAFTRPADYFAEMVKTDSHMERIRQRLLDESAGMKKSEDKRKEREGKKFGKQVQIEKLKEREKSKKDMEERLKGLKRKRKDVLDNAQADDDAFDVAVEDAISDRPAKRGRGNGRGRGVTRESRDKKYGFGGADRRSKSNTRESTDNFESTRKGQFRGGSSRGSRGGSRGGARGGRGGGGSRGARGGGGSRGGTRRLGKSKREASRSKA